MRHFDLAARNALLLGLVALGALFSLLSPFFLTVGNLEDVATQSAILGLVAVPMTALVLAGGVDFSVGSTIGISGVTAGALVTVSHVNAALAILAGIGIGAVVGCINGLLCGILPLSPVIVTLGMLNAIRGFAFVVDPNPTFNFGSVYAFLGEGKLLGIPALAFVALVAFGLGSIVLNLTPVGRHIYAAGVNREAAFLSGVRVRKVSFSLYAVTGTVAGFGGVLLSSQLNAAAPATLGLGFELQVLTAVLLGGVAFGGGRGRLLGVLIAVCLLGVLQNGLALLNVSQNEQLIAEGAVLVAAAALDVLIVWDEKRRYAASAVSDVDEVEYDRGGPELTAKGLSHPSGADQGAE